METSAQLLTPRVQGHPPASSPDSRGQTVALLSTSQSLLYVSIHLVILENSDGGSRYWYQQGLTFFLALSFGDSKTDVFTNKNFF